MNIRFSLGLSTALFLLIASELQAQGREDLVTVPEKQTNVVPAGTHREVWLKVYYAKTNIIKVEDLCKDGFPQIENEAEVEELNRCDRLVRAEVSAKMRFDTGDATALDAKAAYMGFDDVNYIGEDGNRKTIPVYKGVIPDHAEYNFLFEPKYDEHLQFRGAGKDARLTIVTCGPTNSPFAQEEGATDIQIVDSTRGSLKREPIEASLVHAFKDKTTAIGRSGERTKQPWKALAIISQSEKKQMSDKPKDWEDRTECLGPQYRIKSEFCIRPFAMSLFPPMPGVGLYFGDDKLGSTSLSTVTTNLGAGAGIKFSFICKSVEFAPRDRYWSKSKRTETVKDESQGEQEQNALEELSQVADTATAVAIDQTTSDKGENLKPSTLRHIAQTGGEAFYQEISEREPSPFWDRFGLGFYLDAYIDSNGFGSQDSQWMLGWALTIEVRVFPWNLSQYLHAPTAEYLNIRDYNYTNLNFFVGVQDWFVGQRANDIDYSDSAFVGLIVGLSLDLPLPRKTPFKCWNEDKGKMVDCTKEQKSQLINQLLEDQMKKIRKKESNYSAPIVT